MLIGKRIKRILIIISSLILIVIVYYLYQKNRKIEVYPIYHMKYIGNNSFYELEYAVKNFHFGKNQFKQLDILAKRILLDSLRNGYITNVNSEILLVFINGAYFTLTPEYKGLDFTIDWYDAATYNIIAFYRWNLAVGKNISKEYYKGSWLLIGNEVFLSITDTTLDIDKSLLPYYNKK